MSPSDLFWSPLGHVVLGVACGVYLRILAVAWADFLNLRSPIPVQPKGTDPMAGYLNRFIDLGFPDLGGVDENNRAIVWVKMRNPRLIAGDDLIGDSAKTVRLDPETGKPIEVSAGREMFGTFAKLILAGNVWDATSLDDDPPLLPMPPSAADVGKMPIEILNRLGEELSKRNPK
jgi:hypothetical protein